LIRHRQAFGVSRGFSPEDCCLQYRQLSIKQLVGQLLYCKPGCSGSGYDQKKCCYTISATRKNVNHFSDQKKCKPIQRPGKMSTNSATRKNVNQFSDQKNVKHFSDQEKCKPFQLIPVNKTNLKEGSS